MSETIDLPARLLQFERKYVTAALKHTGGNVAGAARLLGMPKRTLWYRLKGELKINPDDYRVKGDAS